MAISETCKRAQPGMHGRKSVKSEQFKRPVKKLGFGAITRALVMTANGPLMSSCAQHGTLFAAMVPKSLSTASSSYGSLLKQQPRRRWALLLCFFLALFFLHTYLYCLASIVYNYAWWVLFSGTVHVARPTPATSATDPPPLVPKIIHQTWRNATIPDKWKAASQSCVDLHPGYKYMLWTDAEAEKLIATKFPWFIQRYRQYTYNIQRADALRYFVLYEYGGIYLDLDIKCLKPLDFLRAFNFTAPKTYPVGLSNDILVAQPADPFAARLIHNLQYWDQWFLVKYATVMFSTGPMFVTVQYVLYRLKGGVTMLPADLYGKYAKGNPEALMQHLHGSSWHGGDAKVVFWLEAYWLQLVVVGCLVAGGVAGWMHGRYVRRRSGGAKREAAAAAAAAAAGGGGGGGGSPSKMPALHREFPDQEV